jgi:hypothetical protein
LSTPEYFERWFRAKNQPILPLSQQEAEAKHRAGEPYVAVLHTNGEKFAVDIAGDWVTVMFFDPSDRLYLKYDFKKVEPERLFLSLASHIQYGGESNRPETTVTFAFKVDGNIIIERRNMITGDVEEKDSYGNPDPNWEAYPAFGDYHSVCRLNREA